MSTKKRTSKKRIPRPHARKAGWITYGTPVVCLVRDENNIVRLHEGVVCSRDNCTSHHQADNTTSTVIHGDLAFNRLADNADDAYEKGYRVNDPCLLRQDEIGYFSTVAIVHRWFSSRFSIDERKRIFRLFWLQDFGQFDEIKD